MSIDTKTMGAAAAFVEPRIAALEDKYDNLPKVFTPKGRVDTVADLTNVQDPEEGWVYLVGLESDPNKPEYWYTAAGTWEYFGQQVDINISNAGDITINGQLVRKTLTQAEYDLLDPPDPKCEYNIIAST